VAHRPEVWLARHGETDWSATGKHTGRTDVPLNDHGREAARRLADILRDHQFDVVLTSPMSRATDTAAVAGFGERAETDPDLKEWDYGDYEGMTTKQIRVGRPGWQVFTDGCPGGETLAEVAARADRVIAKLRAREGTALLFGHGHSLRVLAARWVEQPPLVGANLALATATVSVLAWERETPVISRWNAP
jgi:broad specificity phosphatase PhoE